MANLGGPVFISFRRKRLQETNTLSAALHDRAVSTWRDDLLNEPTGATIRSVLNDNITSGAVLWLTRRAVPATVFEGVPLSDRQMQDLVNLTGADGRGFGYTYSDRGDRLLPAACLAAYHDCPLAADLIADQAQCNQPTTPFAAEG